MPLGIINRTVEFYEDGLSSLSERLRKNWLQKLDSVETPDDSLTNLTWLYDMHPVGLELEGSQKKPEFGERCLSKCPSYSQQPFTGSLCDPQVRLDYRTKWTGKPPFSYATLICLAMRELGKPKVTLSDIYGWIMNNFAYYRHTDSSWQNSVRHNLSLNKCFEKVPRDKNERGKGGFWRVNPKHVDWLEANLAKCKRVAPPPGPAPPVPRSMLLQQRQQIHGQFVQHSFAPDASRQLNMASSVNYSQTYGISPESVRAGGPIAISPLSGSSSSSLSSSPISLSSAPSPANSAVYKQHSASFSHPLIPPIVANTVAHFSPDLEKDSAHRTSSLSLLQPELAVPGQVSHHTRRRKSPLPRHTALSDNEHNDLRLAELNFEVRAQSLLRASVAPTGNAPESKPVGNLDSKRRYTTPMPQHISPKLDHIVGEAKFRRVHCGDASLQSNRPDIVRKQRSRSSIPIEETHLESSGSDYADDLRSKTEKRLRLGRQPMKIKQFPTRTLPPRRRHSRWAVSRNSPNTPQTCLTEETLQSAITVTQVKKHILSSGGAGQNTISSPSYLLPLVDEDEIGCPWPPINSASYSTKSSSGRNLHTSSLTSLPKLPLREPARVTPPYVPAGLSPRSRGLNKRDSPSSAASSSSIGSSLSGTCSTTHSDGYLYHSISPQGHSTPKRVETQTCKQSSATNGTENNTDFSVRFSRLYPTSGEAEAHLGTSPDRLRMPKWASVFLSDGEDAELEPVFWTQTDESEQDAIDLLAHLESDDSDKVFPDMSDSGNSTLHQTSPNESYLSYTSGLTDVLQPLDTDDSQLSNSEKTVNQTSSFNPQPVVSSPMFDHFGLDSSDLDFQSLDGLVEASGPIPLDLDFSLTASLNTPYSSSSHESGDLSSRVFSPKPWSSSFSATSSETVTQSWLGESQLFSSSNCLLSFLDGSESIFVKNNTLPEGENEEYTRSDRLSTPPSH